MIIPISITTIITVIKITEYTKNNNSFFVANSKSQCNKDIVLLFQLIQVKQTDISEQRFVIIQQN